MPKTDTIEITWNEAGLVPAVIQDAATLEVLMLAWMNQDALTRTEETGFVHFWSRSRQRLWKKGETSGNVLQLVDLSVDCDGDTLLLQVTPAGPTCHTGDRTCFSPQGVEPQGFGDLESLWRVIRDRIKTPTEQSYTARLAAGGPSATGGKVIEEAGEVVEAAIQHSRSAAGDERVAQEAADVIFHLFALLAERDVPASLMIEELRGRRSPTDR